MPVYMNFKATIFPLSTTLADCTGSKMLYFYYYSFSKSSFTYSLKSILLYIFFEKYADYKYQIQ